METTLKKQSSFRLKEKTQEWIVDIISYLFIALFIYTAADKFGKFENFSAFIGRLALIKYIAIYVAWMIPLSEIGISFLLLFPSTKKLGLYAAFSLMVLFTTYLIYMKLTAKVLPCHCGGAISTLSWVQHIWFNIVFIFLSVIAIFLNSKK